MMNFGESIIHFWNVTSLKVMDVIEHEVAFFLFSEHLDKYFEPIFPGDPLL